MEIDVILVPVVSASSQIVALFWNLFTALALILIGYLVARAVSFLITTLLKLIQLDTLAQKAGFNQLLEKTEIKRTLAELIGDALYWVIVFITIIGLARYYVLPIDAALNSLLGYFGLIFVAAMVLGIGLFFASLISGIVKTVAVNFGIEGGRTLSRIIYYIVVVFSFIAALAQLGINPEVFVPQIGVIIGAFGLAAAIAFGLGCKDMAADFLHNLFKGK